MNSFDQHLGQCQQGPLQSAGISTLQVNVGRLCNLQCRHCHVSGSPNRTEVMDWPTMEAILRLSDSLPGVLVDITGGAPEINPHFRRFVKALRDKGHPVQVRTNLSIFFEPGHEDLPAFFRDQAVALVASLPCYLEDNVNAQRGSGVYDKSIRGLKALNELGYGSCEQLQLNLVFNPGGPSLPPSQEVLEAAYRRELKERHGIVFDRLIAITNMPIGRFFEDLRRQGKDEQYRDLLVENFNCHTVEGLMCRHQICVDWDGRLYDCDFNLSLELPLSEGLPESVTRASLPPLKKRLIATAEHCFGCTAGAGSSCGGSLVA